MSSSNNKDVFDIGTTYYQVVLLNERGEIAAEEEGGKPTFAVTGEEVYPFSAQNMEFSDIPLKGEFLDKNKEEDKEVDESKNQKKPREEATKEGKE